MKYIITTILCFLTVCSALAEHNEKVDEVRTFHKNLLNASGQETVTLRIIGDSESSPFKWNISVNSKNRKLFYVEHDDSWLDKFFDDDGYVEGCEGYSTCKQKWYFNDLPEIIRNSFYSMEKPDHSVAQYQIDTLKSLAKEFLRNKGLEKSQVDSVIKEMIDMLSDTYKGFCPPMTPVQNDVCYMYAPSLGYYVPFWDD